MPAGARPPPLTIPPFQQSVVASLPCIIIERLIEAPPHHRELHGTITRHDTFSDKHRPVLLQPLVGEHVEQLVRGDAFDAGRRSARVATQNDVRVVAFACIQAGDHARGAPHGYLTVHAGVHRVDHHALMVRAGDGFV